MSSIQPLSQSTIKPTPGILETMTLDEVRDFHPEVVVMSIASTEPHGPHLPYGTDTFAGDAYTSEAVRLANEMGARVLRYPTLPIGNNVNFKAWPFACRIRVSTLMTVLSDIVTALHEDGVHKVVFVNSHGGNTDTLSASMRELFHQFQQEVFVCYCHGTDFAEETRPQDLFNDGSPHAGDYETSMMLHLVPGLVRMDKARSNPLQQPMMADSLKKVRWVRPWYRLMPEANAGHPEEATAEKGRLIFESSVKGLAAFLVELSAQPWHPNFPYPEKSA
jgi:creatinine amidohydrolase